MKYTHTTEIIDQDEGKYHIPGVHNMQQTLCGYVDCVGETSHHYTDHPVNCRECINAYKAIKAMKFPKGYFEGE